MRIGFKKATHYLLNHRLVALLLTFAVTCVPILAIFGFGILYASLVTLRKGIYEGALFAIAATLPFLLRFGVLGSADFNYLQWVATYGFIIATNILTWGFACLLYRRADWSQILQVAALMGVLVISVTHLINPNIADWWGKQILLPNELADFLTKILGSTPSPEELENIRRNMQMRATGYIVSTLLLASLLQLVVARFWQSAVFQTGMLRRELHNIRLSKLAGILFIVSIVLLYLGNSVVVDVMPVVLMLFTAAGLSLAHYMFKFVPSSTRLFWICLMYITLIYKSEFAYILALMAVADIWIDVRKRLIKTIV